MIRGGRREVRDGVARTQRATVVDGQRVFAEAREATARRPAESRRPEVLRGCTLDSVDGSAVERATEGVRELDDLLAASAGMGGERRSARDVEGVPEHSQ